MAKMWCINCQAERNYPCSCEMISCNHSCPTCGKNTLASIVPNQNDAGYSLIKQMVGEAQRIAQRTGRTGDIEVVKDISACGSNYQAQVLVYNTYSGSFQVSKR